VSQDTVASIDEQKAKWQEELLSLEQILESVLADQKRLDADLQQTANENEALKKTNGEFKERINLLEGLCQQIADLKKSIAKRESAIKALRAQLKKEETKVQTQKLGVAADEEELLELQNQLESLSLTDVEQAKRAQTLVILEAGLEKLKTDCERLESAVS